MSDLEPPLARRWWDIGLDVVAVLGVIAVLALPAAALASDPRVPHLVDASVVLPPLRSGPSGQPLRDLPTFTSGSDAESAVAAGAVLTREPAMAAALDQQFRSVFGGRGAPELQALVQNASIPVSYTNASASGGYGYPYQFTRADAFLDATLGRAAVAPAAVAPINDLAGLLVLAAVEFPSQYPNAASIAYALYNRARRTDACEPQLNLAFLLSTDASPPDVAVATEFRRAARDCPGDPTPLWLLGQYQSLRRQPAHATFAQLQERFPQSALGWSGEADALVRLGYRVDVGQPFTARAAFRRAQRLYRRAESLDPDPGLVAGEARATAGLGDFAGAVRAQRRALAGAGPGSPFKTRLVDYLESARHFSEAARVDADVIAAGTTAATGPALFAKGSDAGDALAGDDALGPISIGAERLRPVRLTVGSASLAYTGGVTDISFIPEFRSVFGVTGNSSNCPAISRARDLLLAGRPADALTAIATTPAPSVDYSAPTSSDATNTGACDPREGLLRAVANFEAGNQPAAVAAVPAGYAPPGLAKDLNPPLAQILDADQNMWRYAGDLGKAARAAQQWTDREPSDPFGPDRAGEIAYLRGNFDTAASDFAEAEKRATGAQVATEELKRGTAIDRGGNPKGAVPVLLAADRVASAAARSTPHNLRAGTVPQGLLDSYNARLQAGDAEMRRHEFAAAEGDYQAARAREAQLPEPRDTPGIFASRAEELLRPEVLENNQALVLVHLGRADDALRAINRAVAFDPANPVFLANKGFVESELDRKEVAAASYRAALASDPTSFQAANNLGVLLAEEHHLGSAADAFGQALAANPDDASAEFNLGIALDRMGPAHMLEAQGVFAAATRREPELREHDRTFIVDDDTYFSTLDLSKPLPPTWQFASSSKRAPITLGGVLLLLLLFRLVKTAAQSRASDKAAERALRASKKQFSSKLAEFGASAPGVLAVVAVVAVFVYPLARSSGTTTGDALLLGTGIAVVTLAFMRMRSAIARRNGVAAQHYPWLPAVFVGGAAALVGIAFAPMPATKGEGLPTHARWLGTGLLSALALTLLVFGRFSGVPFATGLGAICLVMTTSALMPVEPYDGAFLKKRHVELSIVIALATIGVLVETGLL